MLPPNLDLYVGKFFREDLFIYDIEKIYYVESKESYILMDFIKNCSTFKRCFFSCNPFHFHKVKEITKEAFLTSRIKDLRDLAKGILKIERISKCFQYGDSIILRSLKS